MDQFIAKSEERSLNDEQKQLISIIGENERLRLQLSKIQDESYGKTLQINGLKSQIETLQSKLTKSNAADINSSLIDTESNAIGEQYREIQLQVSQKEKEIEELKSAHYQTLNTKEKRIIYLEGKLISLTRIEKEKIELEKKIKALIEENSAIQKELENANKVSKEFDEKNSADKTKNEEIEREIEKPKIEEVTEVETLPNTDEILSEIAKQKEIIEELSAKIKEDEKELNQKNALLEQQNFKINELTLSLNSYKELCTNYQKQILEITNSEEEKKSILHRNSTLSADNDKLLLELSSKSQTIEELRQINSKLAEDIDSSSKSQNSDEIYQLKMKIMMLQAEIENKESQLEKAWKERIIHKERADNLEKYFQDEKLDHKKEMLFLQTKVAKLDEDYKANQLQTLSLTEYINKIEFSLENNKKKLEKNKEKIRQMKRKNKTNEEDCRNMNEIISQLSEEKAKIETINKKNENKYREDLKKNEAAIKQLSTKINNLETKISEQSTILASKDQLISAANKQINIFKRKTNPQNTNSNKNFEEKIGAQNRRIEAYESQIKMLKEMVKGLQNDVKTKTQEIIRYKKSRSEHVSPQMLGTKNRIPEFSPYRFMDKNPYANDNFKLVIPDLDELNRESPFVRRKNAVNIFKITSPIKQKSKFDLRASNDFAMSKGELM